MKRKKIGIGIILVFLFVMALGMTSLAAGNTKTMKNKKWISGTCRTYIDTDHDGVIDDYTASDNYYKITIAKQGYIMVDIKKSSPAGRQEYIDYERENDDEFDESDMEEKITVNVVNSKKEEIAGYDSDECKKFSWAVKKGTYYLSVDGDAAYKLRYTFTPVAKISKAGKNFAKAATIKKGSTIKNLLLTNGGIPEHYYKLKLTKKTKVTLACDSKMEGDELSTLTAQMYVKKGKNYRHLNSKGKLVSGYATKIKGKKNITYTLPKGTYYLRLWASGSGYYSFKWK